MILLRGSKEWIKIVIIEIIQKKKNGVINSPNLYSEGKESFLVEIYRNETDFEILKALNNRLENLDNFIKEGEILERDISIKLTFTAAFSLQKYIHIHFKIEYQSPVNLVLISKRIQESLHGFKSQEWGITISLDYDKKDRYTFHLLKKEEEKFNEYLEQNREHNDFFELYKTFTSVLALENGLKEDQLIQWIPNKISYQIEDYLRKKKLEN